ncbi:DUF7507 domain-containing protein [Zhengella mangrovi]|uniref:DUF7507 domain-containing protein n=1 Tax=Zhengella mangrovi TaxID=1982044 RepID=UPI0013FD55A8|nr:DUF11 domain-containing protein [Zhengella mangrovi]
MKTRICRASHGHVCRQPDAGSQDPVRRDWSSRCAPAGWSWLGFRPGLIFGTLSFSGLMAALQALPVSELRVPSVWLVVSRLLPYARLRDNLGSHINRARMARHEGGVWENMAMIQKTTGPASSFLRRRLTSTAIATVMAMTGVVPAFATIDNTATVSGTPAGGTLGGTLTDTQSVAVEVANPALTVTKAADDNTLRNAGDTIVYTYTVVNSGNVTIKGIKLTDTHKGQTGALPVSNEAILSDADPRGASTDAAVDGIWDTLYPGDSITFTSSYVVTQADIDSGADIVNTVNYDATYDAPAGPVDVFDHTDTITETVTVAAADPQLTINKTADITTGAKAGDVITYTYLVTNTGNVRIDNVSVADTHKGVAGALLPASEVIVDNTDPRGDSNVDATANDGIWSTLYPGDSIKFTATYTVTQDDVDNLQ